MSKAKRGEIWMIDMGLVQKTRPCVILSIDYLEHDRKVTTRLVQRDGRVYWLDRYLDTDEGRRALDVTTVGFQELQLDPHARAFMDIALNQNNFASAAMPKRSK